MKTLKKNLKQIFTWPVILMLFGGLVIYWGAAEIGVWLLLIGRVACQ